ncbi:hypothetical protein BV25DRAFT_324673 [Artomyces pyxidatus]|uniref:Uncharacterized protein n=1 Tax=Artomyces pyxidatus TaxID=48021 RepID=A0ACB8T628_9AGAM|nr:hypothetical protein BV25DRAFT_324673 [Artomyces pyxidatus]
MSPSQAHPGRHPLPSWSCTRASIVADMPQLGNRGHQVRPFFDCVHSFFDRVHPFPSKHRLFFFADAINSYSFDARRSDLTTAHHPLPSRPPPELSMQSSQPPLVKRRKPHFSPSYPSAGYSASQPTASRGEPASASQRPAVPYTAMPLMFHVPALSMGIILSLRNPYLQALSLRP